MGGLGLGGRARARWEVYVSFFICDHDEQESHVSFISCNHFLVSLL